MRPISNLVGVVSKEASGCGLKGDQRAWVASACGLKSRLASNTPSLGEYSLKTDPSLAGSSALPQPSTWLVPAGRTRGKNWNKERLRAKVKSSDHVLLLVLATLSRKCSSSPWRIR